MSTVEDLIQQAKGADEAADEAAAALVELGVAALPAVLESLAKASWISPVGRLPWVVRSIHGTHAVPILLDHIGAEQRALRESCIAALGRSHDERAVEPLSLLLTDRDGLTTTRGHAAEALGNLGFDSVTGLLKEVLADAAAEEPEAEEWPMLVVATATALAKFGDHRGFPALVALLDVDFSPTRARAAKAFELVVGPQMVAVLTRALEDPDSEVREAAVDPLFLVGTRESIDVLVEHIDDPNDDVAARIEVRIGDCLGAHGDADELKTAWRKLRPRLPDGVCHRLGHPIEVTELVDVLLENSRPEVATELTTITGAGIDELFETGQGQEIRTVVEGSGLVAGGLYKWGHPVAPEKV